MWKHSFISYLQIMCTMYCIPGLRQHKEEANIKQQAAVSALGAPLSFTAPADCPGPRFSPSQGCWFLPWCCCRTRLVTRLVWVRQQSPTPAAGSARCGQPHGLGHSRLPAPQPWQSSPAHAAACCRVISAPSPFARTFDKKHASHWVVPSVWRYGRKEVFG